jgi:hypothetical protein
MDTMLYKLIGYIFSLLIGISIGNIIMIVLTGWKEYYNYFLMLIYLKHTELYAYQSAINCYSFTLSGKKNVLFIDYNLDRNYIELYNLKNGSRLATDNIDCILAYSQLSNIILSYVLNNLKNIIGSSSDIPNYFVSEFHELKENKLKTESRKVKIIYRILNIIIYH